jgi:ADP-heptose:LPS heptosyltransferase
VPPAERPRLLVLRALGLGDLLTSFPALRALREGFPEHELVLAAPASLEPLALLSDAVDRVQHAAGLAPLRGVDGADLAVNLHGRGHASHRVLLATRPRRLVAFTHDAVPESRGMPEWRGDEHEVWRWCRLVKEGLGIPTHPGRLEMSPPRVEPPVVARGATLVHPGAKSSARRWPVERWAAVARAERRAGRRVVVTGSEREVDLARELARQAGLDDDCVLAGHTDLLGLAGVVAACSRLACGDTGIAHLATALRRPSVVLFGPMSPALWGPPPRPWHRVIWKGESSDPLGDQPSAGLLRIGVEEVVAALDGVPEASSSRSRPSTFAGTGERSRSTQGRPREASSRPTQAAVRS